MTKLIIVGAPGPATLPPPFISDLQHWWDFTDASQVFQDVGGITPSGDGDPILRVNNKGYDGQPLIDAVSQLKYTEDLLPGINVGTNIGLLPLITVLNNALSTDGITVVLIVRSQDSATVNPLKWEFSGDISQIQADIDGSGNWEVQFDLADERDTVKSVVPDELLSVYGAIKGGSLDYKASGAPLQSGSSGYPVTDAGLTITVGDFTGNIAEVLIYDFKLSVAQQAALEQRNNTKYGGLPVIIPSGPVPPASANLLHWVDAADAGTVWADLAGTIPATNGVTVERIDNKGTRGTPFLRVGFGGVEYKTSVLNGLNVIEFTSANGQLTITAESPGLPISATGFTTALVTRRRGTVPVGNPILWRWSPAAGSPDPSLRLKGGSQDLAADVTGNPEEILVGASGLDTWYLIYISVDPVGADDAKYGSPGPEIITPFGVPTDIPDLADVRWGTSNITMENAEAFFWDRPLTPIERADLVSYVTAKYGVIGPPPYDSLILASSPVAFYKLDETVGLVMADSSGNANDGDYTGTVTLGQPQVVNDGGNSALFSGVAGSFANIMPGVMDVPTSTSPKTLECWINTFDTVGPIMVARGPSGTPVFGIYMGNDGLQAGNGQIFVFMRDNLALGISTLASPLTYNDGANHHIVVTLDALKNYILYVDGVAVHTSVHILTVGINTNDPQLGEDAITTGGAPHGSFNGRIDNAAIYDVALSAGTVLAHYNAGI